MFPEISWFDSPAALTAKADLSLPRMRLVEDYVVAAPVRDGFCVICERVTPMTVFGGAMLGKHINLREGMVCQVCGLNARSRLLAHVMAELFPSSDANLALMEAFTPLARIMPQRWPGIALSEYFGPDVNPGAIMPRPAFQGTKESAAHQDLMDLGYGDSSLDGIVHNDVLEHVPDVRVALAEMFRVLRPGGTALFTMPWFPWEAKTLVRGKLLPDGTLQEFLPSEYHGDGLREGGIYTFYNFGADLGSMLHDAGFSVVRYAVCYAPSCGFLTNNFREGMDGMMVPSVLAAVKTL